MANNRIELADVIRQFMGPYRQHFGRQMLPSHRRALNDICRCMTPAMGGGRYQCRDCEETFWSYHGCRNRACPKCHGRQIAIWLQKRTAELLPCDYFHVVATVPQELREFFLREQKLCYGIFMKSVAAALCELARNRRYVGATPGILAVLHTWTAQMRYHPHVHLLVTGGGVSEDGSTWHSAANRFLVPVRKLSLMIRQRFAHALQKERPSLFAQIPASVWRKEWCSFCKHFGSGSEAVLQYLARYVFRIAINNNRILAMDQTHVTFRYKEKKTQTWKIERIPGVQFIRRFLLHVLPRGFHKVRYYGLWSATNHKRQAALRIRLQVAEIQRAANEPIKVADLAETALTRSGMESHACITKCPKCKSANVLLLERLPRGMNMVT